MRPAIAAGRSTAGSGSSQSAKRWRPAMVMDVIQMQQDQSLGSRSHTARDVAIDIHADGGTGTLEALSVDADNEDFKALVKGKRRDCLRRFGGGAGLAVALASDAVNGIRGDDEDVQRRQEAFGRNTYPTRKHKTFWNHAMDAICNVYLVVLLVRACVSLAFDIKNHGLKDGWYDGVAILLTVFLVAAVSAVSNHSQAKRFDRLTSQSDDVAVTVVRSGRRQKVSVFDVVVGDVVALKVGDAVPADGVLLDGHSLVVDESSMTGEAHPVHVAADENPFLAAGVRVIDGYGLMLVTAVGKDTTLGEMMDSINEETDTTPLRERLASNTGKFGITDFAGSVKKVQGPPLLGMEQDTISGIFGGVVGVFLQTVAVPKGLPLGVSLMLAWFMKRMLKDRVLVRQLETCTAMGSVTSICTSKTGTLTLNQMKVTDFWVGTEQPAVAGVNGGVVSLLCQGAGLNTTGSVYMQDSFSPPEISESPTEKALLSWAVAELGMDTDALRRSCKVLNVEAFNSDKKRSGVLVRDNATGAVIAHWKGVAEMVLASCSAYVGADGAARELGVEQRRDLEKVISDMAADGVQCIAFAYKQVHGKHSKIDDEGLTLLGFVGLKDPCRPEVRTAIEACTKAGVAVKMVTGDNVLTARAIARECGIVSDSDRDGIVMEGHEFRAMSPEEQLEMVDRIRVMARSLPMDKLVLVQRLKQKGHVVAVTGDGTNDAPALKEADVGLSMGIRGTEVAKESSDIIFLSDNFATIVPAISWGRSNYHNIQKFIQLQLTVNVAVVIINFISVVTTGKIPLPTIHLLWVTLIVDTMGALALATDTPNKALMPGSPIGGTAPLISNAMWRNLAAQAAFQVTVLLALQYRGRHIFGVVEKANGIMIFNAFVLCQAFNEFNAREIERKNVFAGVLRNRMFLGIIAVTIAMQVLMVELLTRFAGTQRLGLSQWGVCVAIAAMSWPIGWAVKFIPVPDRPLPEVLARWKCF